ncbi:MAG: Gfo/Idh/MocA family oxidoreductase, partial [Planctomycetes bacterium]|nr:Gfo/Idh/MocA family oxidoreductase [Planctomycetota bacterium]
MSGKHKSSTVTRRRFLQASGVAAGTAVARWLHAPSVVRATPSNERIRIGFIGVGGRGFRAHVKRLAKLHQEGAPIELVGVCDVFSEYRQRAADYIEKTTGTKPTLYVDFREMIGSGNLDAVSIATPDHWHAKQVIESLKAGLHVYCEKPMTKYVQEAVDVVRVWKDTGRVMQVGVQSTSLPVWDRARELMQQGLLGKVLMYQTEYFRNSAMGQWRYYRLTKSMTPQTIDWRRWLGVDDGLAPEMPFDRAVFRQWRRFWPFGSGLFTDLFVHRTTVMLKATGLRFPGRVVGGGIYLEYDGREVPDVATVVADFPEGVQGLVTATMCCQNTPILQTIRGHFGSFVFGTGAAFTGFDFVPERPQVTRDSKLKSRRIEVGEVKDPTHAHFANWIAAIRAGDPLACHNPPDLGAAAVTTVLLGARSYREGKVFRFDSRTMQVTEGDGSWASQWEERSRRRAKPRHIPGWKAGDRGSVLEEPDYMSLGGP